MRSLGLRSTRAVLVSGRSIRLIRLSKVRLGLRKVRYRRRRRSGKCYPPNFCRVGGHANRLVVCDVFFTLMIRRSRRTLALPLFLAKSFILFPLSRSSTLASLFTPLSFLFRISSRSFLSALSSSLASPSLCVWVEIRIVRSCWSAFSVRCWCSRASTLPSTHISTVMSRRLWSRLVRIPPLAPIPSPRLPSRRAVVS